MRSQALRTGFVLGTDTMPVVRVLELARRAEELGYEVLWMGETWGRDAFSFLTRVALETRRIRLGTSVISTFSRGPGLLAQSIATLDELSEGRAVLGLGPSSRKLVEDWHGRRFDRPIARIRELVPLLRRILSGERVDFEGEFFRMQGLRLPFDPPRPGIPIYLGALSPKHIELAGELADGWLPTHVSSEHLEPLRAPLVEGASRAGRDPDEVVQAPWILTCAADDAEWARALAREHLAFFTIAYGDAYERQARRYGFVEEVDRLHALWSGDRANLATGVSDAMLDALAVTGTPDRCREAYAALRARGIDLPGVLLPTRAPFEIVRGTLEAMSPRAEEAG